MPGLSAVVFIPDDTAKTGYSRPMMLQNIMGTPLLSWLASSLMAGGVGRFFLVCHERFKREARACFPDDVEFSCPSVEATSDQLHVFLSTADERSFCHLRRTRSSLIPLPSRARSRLYRSKRSWRRSTRSSSLRRS